MKPPRPAHSRATCANLIELADLVELDNITSDILPAYLQVLLSVKLTEPDYLCRKAAMRLVTYAPPLSPVVLAMALRGMARHELPTCSARPDQLTLGGILRRLYRIWPFKLR